MISCVHSGVILHTKYLNFDWRVTICTDFRVKGRAIPEM